MRYKARWIPEPVVSGNTAKVAETRQDVVRRPNIIYAESFRPKPTNDRTKHMRRARRRRRRARANRLALQGLTMVLMMIQIAMLDGATFIQTVVLLAGIMACSGIMLLLDIGERKER